MIATMKTVKMHRKYAIYTTFLDSMLELEEIAWDNETELDAYRRGFKKLDQIAAALRDEYANPGSFSGTQPPRYEQSITSSALPIISKENETATIDIIAYDIGTCGTIKVLESYRILAKTNEELQEAYDKRRKQLLAERPTEFPEGLE